METTAPEAVDFSKETAITKEMYGLNDDATKDYGTQMLRARRLVERGVRFIQVVSGTLDIKGDNRDWDAHQDLEENHGAHARAIDKPIAGLLADLKSRGLLESTLVVWTSECRADLVRSGAARVPRSQPVGLHAMDGRRRRQRRLHLRSDR